MANVLGLSTELEEDSFGIDMPDEVKAQLTEKEVRPDWLVHGNRMRDIRLDANTLVMMIRRGDDYIVPKGDTELRPGDKVLCITGEKARLPEDYAVSGREGSVTRLCARWEVSCAGAGASDIRPTERTTGPSCRPTAGRKRLFPISI